MIIILAAATIGTIALLGKAKLTSVKFKKSKKLKKDDNILFVGNSITAEYFNGAYISWTYSSLIKSRLKTQGKTADILAVGGMTTIWMLSNLPTQLAKKKYARVYIYGGINDAYSLLKPTDIVGRVQKMVDLVVAQGGEAYIILGYDTEKFAKNNNYSAITDTLGNVLTSKQQMIDRKQLYIQYQKLLKSTIKNATVVSEFNLDASMCFDGIHPTAAAHQIIATELLKGIEYEN